jgi:hypothetical protein
MPQFSIKAMALMVALLATFLGTLAASDRGPKTMAIGMTMYLAIVVLWIRYGPKFENKPRFRAGISGESGRRQSHYLAIALNIAFVADWMGGMVTVQRRRKPTSYNRV